MPFFKVTTHAMLVEAENALEAAMTAYRRFGDSNPHQFDVVGPETETQTVALTTEQQDEAITIAFGKKIQIRERR